MLGVGRGHGALAVAAQVRDDQRELACQLRRDLVPADVRLRITVQQQQRRTRAADAREDLGTLGLETPLGETRKQLRQVGHQSRLPCNGSPADILTAESFGPVDPGNGLIGARLRLGHRAPERRDAEHATAGGNEAFAVALRAGVEDLHILHAAGRVETADLGSLRIVARDSPWPPSRRSAPPRRASAGRSCRARRRRWPAARPAGPISAASSAPGIRDRRSGHCIR